MKPFVKSVLLSQFPDWVASKMEFSTRNLLRIYVCFIVLSCLPLFVQTLSLGFGYWDYFNWRYKHFPKGDWLSWGSLIPNLYFNLFEIPGIFRPTSGLFSHLSFLLLGGQFWSWWVVRWLMKGSCAFLVHRLAVRLGVHPAVGLIAVAVFWFHPVPFEMQLNTSDPLVVFFALCLLLLIWPREPAEGMPSLDIRRFSTARYCGLLAVWLLLLGAKEIVLGFALMILVMFHVRAKLALSSWIRLLPFDFSFLFALYRVYAVASSSLYRVQVVAPEKSAGHHLSVWGGRFLTHLHYLIPFDSNTVWFYVFLILIVWSIFVVLRELRGGIFTPVVVLSGAIVSLTLLSSVPASYPPVVAARYAIPLVPLFGIVLAYCVNEFRHWKTGLALGICIVFPCLTLGDIYKQHVANAQIFAEFQHVVNCVWNEAQDGRSVYIVEDGEPSTIIHDFLKTYSSAFYGLAPVSRVKLVSEPPWLEEPAIVVASRPPGEILGALRYAPGLRTGKILGFSRAPGAGLRVVSNILAGASARLGNTSATRYDIGLSVIDSSTRWYIYLVGKGVGGVEFRSFDGSEGNVEFKGNGVPGLSLSGGSSGRIKLTAGQSIYIPFENVGGARVFVLPGKVVVSKGRVLFGVTSESRGDLWNKILPGPNPVSIPSTPVLHFESDQRYWIFFYAPEDVEFELVELQPPVSLEVTVFRTFVEFGSLTF